MDGMMHAVTSCEDVLHWNMSAPLVAVSKGAGRNDGTERGV
jgi:hypothetical protein